MIVFLTEVLWVIIQDRVSMKPYQNILKLQTKTNNHKNSFNTAPSHFHHNFPSYLLPHSPVQNLIFKILITVTMFPFAFQSQPIQDPKPDELTLLQTLFMNILQNQRLRHQLDTQTEDISFSVDKKDFNRDHEYKLELELKQVKLENMNSVVRELQSQIVNSDKLRQEVMQRSSQAELMLKQEIAEMRSQVNYYKGKYEEEVNSSKRCNSKLEGEVKALKSQVESKNKELMNKAAQMQAQRARYEKSLETQTLENEKRIKQLRISNETLRNDYSLKEQECFSLKTSLNDCPKLQELNRWINKVKEYEQKQIQACGKMSQMSQQICVSRERYRKLEGEYRQLQKIKQELQNALTENKGNEDSMVLYFDRLQTYEKVIKQLEQEIRKLEAAGKTKDKEHQTKVQALQREKENVVTQWKSIADQMEKQKGILASLQKQVEKYQKHISELNERQNEMIRERQMNQLNYQIRAAENQRNKAQIGQHHYSFIQQKGCQQENRSLSLQSKNELKSSQIQAQSNRILQSHVTYDPPSRQLRSNSSMLRPSSQQRIIYHSDPHSRNSTSRLNTQTSNASSRETGCGECISRIHQTRDYSNRSINTQENRHLRSEQFRVDMSQVTDEKKLLMDKLNVLKPQDTNTSLRGLDRNLTNLYTKNYRQPNPSTQSNLKLNPTHSSKQIMFNNSNKLQLGRAKAEQKENLNDMIVKRYTNLLQQRP